MTDLLRTYETDGVPAPSDFELAIPHHRRPWTYSLNNVILHLGLTWRIPEFRYWLSSLAGNLYTQDQWLDLYGKFTRAFDASDERETQQDALT